MRKSVYTILALSLISFSALADEGKAIMPRTLSLSADAETEADPDTTKISINLRSENQNYQKAKSENDELAKKFEKVVADQKIQPDHVKMTGIMINPEYDYNDGNRRLRNYSASRNYLITIDDVSSYEVFLSKLTGIGEVNVEGIDFTLKDQEAEASKARLKAIEKVKKQADEIAGAFGVKLSKVLNISQSGNIQRPPFHPMPVMMKSEMGMAADRAEPPSASPGKIKITQSVSVTFEIE